MKLLGTATLFFALGAAAACGEVTSGGPDGGAGAPDSGSGQNPDSGSTSSGPDLVIAAIDLSATSVAIDEEVTVTATVENRGGEAGEETYELTADGSSVDSQTVAVDPPGEGQDPADTAVEVALAFSSDTPGDYELAVNGEAAGTLTVEEAAAADIVVVEASAAPAEVAPNETVTVMARVQNQGGADGERTIDFTVDGAVEDSRAVTVDAPGDGQTPADTEVEVQFSFSTETSGEYALAVDEVSAGTAVVLAALSVEATAICFEEPPGYTQVTQDADIAAGGFQRIIASCPDDGRVVIGGGVQAVGFFSEEPEIRIQYSRPGSLGGVPRLWVAGVSNAASEARTVRVTAICANEPSGYSHESQSATLTAGSYQRVIAQCANDTSVVLGGGLNIPDISNAEPDTRIQHEYPGTIGGGATHQWLVGISNEGSTEHTVEAIAICADASAPAGYTQQTTTAEIPIGGFSRVISQCPDDGRVVSIGGMRVQGATSDEPETRVQLSRPSTIGGGTRHQWSLGLSDHRTR